jgi:hypothetical protein
VQDWGFGVGSRVKFRGIGLRMAVWLVGLGLVLDGIGWIVVGVGVYDWGHGGRKHARQGKLVQNWGLGLRGQGSGLGFWVEECLLGGGGLGLRVRYSLQG